MIGKLLCRFGLHKMEISGDWYVCRRCGFRRLTEAGIEDFSYRAAEPEITADAYDAALTRIDELNFGRGIEITDEEREELDGLVNAVMRYEAKLAGETTKEVS